MKTPARKGSPSFRNICRLFFLFVAVKGILFVLLLPPWQGPDESQHFSVLLTLIQADPGRLLGVYPSADLQQLILDSLNTYEFWRLSEYHIPRSVVGTGSTSPLFHWGLALPFRYVPVHDLDFVSFLFLLRFLSVGLHLGVVWITFLVATQLSQQQSPWTALSAASIIAFQPQYSFLSGVFIPDNYLVFLLGVIVYVLCRLPNTRYPIGASLLLLLLASLAFATKRTGLVAFPVCGLGILSAAFFTPHIEHRYRLFLTLGTFVACLVIGHVMGLLIYPSVGQWEQQMVLEGGGLVGTLFAEKPDFGEMLRALAVAYVSFWFSYGWMIYKLSYGWYLILGGMCLLGCWGLVKALAQHFESGTFDRQTLAVSFLTIGLVCIVASPVLLLYDSDSAHGRYFFPALVPVAVSLAAGIRESSPRRYQDLACMLTIMFFLFLNVVCVTKYLVPIFHL